MTLHIDLPPQTEHWLRNEARHRGVPPAEFATALLNEQAARSSLASSSEGPGTVHQPIDQKSAGAIALLDSFIAEGAAADPAAKRKADREVEVFKRNVNANRIAAGEEPVFP